MLFLKNNLDLNLSYLSAITTSKNTLQVRLPVGFAGGFLRRQRASTHNNHYKKIKEHMPSGTDLLAAGDQRRAHTYPDFMTIKEQKTPWSYGDSNPGPPACKAGALAN